MTSKNEKEQSVLLSSLLERQVCLPQGHTHRNLRTSSLRTPSHWGWLLFACLWSLSLALPSLSVQTGLEQRPLQEHLSTPTRSAEPHLRLLNLLQDDNGAMTLVESDEGGETNGGEQDSHGAATDDGNNGDSGDDEDDDDDDDAELPATHPLLEDASFNLDALPAPPLGSIDL